MNVQIVWVDERRLEIIPAPMNRDWMDATFKGFANLCLPLRIMNGWGWHVLCPADFRAVWSGGTSKHSVRVFPESLTHTVVDGHTGYGILTFHLPFLIVTPAGWNCQITGPANWFKHGLQPISGMVETDWSYMRLSMNWQFTGPGEVSFKRGDPIARLVPTRRDSGLDMHLEHRTLQGHELEPAFAAHREARSVLTEQLARGEAVPARNQQGFLHKYFDLARMKKIKF